MKSNNLIKFGIFFLVGILFLTSVSAYRSDYQYTSESFSGGFLGGTTGVGTFDKAMCDAGQDFILQVDPFSCTPSVVRSDLLEEESVPVFCKVTALKINPLIDIEALDSVYFTGSGSEHVQNVRFYPSRSALAVDDGELNSPFINELGYVAIVLRRNANESSMPDFVEGNVSAQLRYDIQNAFGVGDATFYLDVPPTEVKDYFQYGFWDGRGYLEAQAVDNDGATVTVYSGRTRVAGNYQNPEILRTISLEKGETSNMIYLPTVDYCLGGIQLKLEDVVNPDTRARLNINGQIVEVAEGERFLENKCQLRSLEKIGISEKLTINCQEDDGRNTFELRISPNVSISVSGNRFGEGEEIGYELGSKLYDGEEKSVYLGYAYLPKGAVDDSELVSVLVSIPSLNAPAKLSQDELRSIERFAESARFKELSGVPALDGLLNVFKAYGFIGELFARWGVSGEDFTWANIGEEKIIEDAKFEINGLVGPKDFDFANSNEDYRNAIEEFDTLIQNYPELKETEASKKYAIRALNEEIVLAQNTNQKKTLVELCDKFKEDFPDESVLPICENQVRISNSELSVESVLVNSRVKEISFEGIYEPSLKDYSATLRITKAGEASIEATLGKNDEFYFGDSNQNLITLKEIEDEYTIIINTNVESRGALSKSFTTPTYTIEKGTKKVIGDYVVSLENVNLKKLAKVEVISNVNRQQTEAEFSFKVGIEKRGIQLAPEKTQEKIEKLNESIASWEKISNGLGKTVTTLKTACLATGGALVLKNLVQNTGGKGVARKEVMQGVNGWNQICADEVSKGNYASEDSCLLDKSDDIDDSVESMHRILTEQNTELDSLEVTSESKGLFAEDQVDTQKLITDYSKNVNSRLPDVAGIDNQKIENSLNLNGWQTNKFSLEELKEIDTYSRVINDQNADPELKKIANTRLKDVLVNVEKNIGNEDVKFIFSDASNIPVEKIGSIIGEDTKELAYLGLTVKDIGSLKDYPLDTPIYILQNRDDGKIYTLVLEDKFTGSLNIISKGEFLEVYNQDGTNANIKEGDETFSLSFKKYDQDAYSNEFKYFSGDNKPLVRYYETGQYKDLPAMIPFDLSDGWFASEIEYEANGRVTKFNLCNVGENQIGESISGGFNGDDICQIIDLRIAQTHNQFYGMDQSETNELINNAVGAIEDASPAPKAGQKVRISTNAGKYDLDTGRPYSETSNIKCQDYMSPKECSILFNVCDPVMCPTSRCNFGGQVNVRDVAQTGIIGSLALCMPNFKGFGGDVYVPVCLTGVQAGVDNWLSVKKSYQDCLERSQETGETVGICDEIQSVYMCEFFWRQGLPLVQAAGPAVLSKVADKVGLGGGEYTNFVSSFNGASDSLKFFTQEYATTSYNAFKVRSTEDIGIGLCQNFGAQTVPKMDVFLDSMTRPDSPTQFSGKFDEIPFTSATTPATSHYKVFYHIYAGKDRGAYYKVFLREGPESSFYQDISGPRIVDSGYIAKGEYASETVDFRDVSGYKELCIQVNGQLECGFKQVSTSFGLEYIEQEYLNNQAGQTDITSENGCISGSASLYNLLDPNVQAGAENAIDPSIYEKGISRICATDNPGKGTDDYYSTEQQRWIDVGYCGDKNLRCWLDTDSVKDTINSPDLIKFFEDDGNITSLESSTLEDLNEHFQTVLSEEGVGVSPQDFEKEIEKIESESNLRTRISLAKDLKAKVYWSNQNAKLHYVIGQSYSQLAVKTYLQLVAQRNSVQEEIDSEPVLDLYDFPWEASDYVSPKYEFEDGLIDTQNPICYKFFEGKWHWTNDCDKVGTSEVTQDCGDTLLDNIEAMDCVDIVTKYDWNPLTNLKGLEGRKTDSAFVENLIGKTYPQGVQLLVDRTTANSEGSTFNTVSKFATTAPLKIMSLQASAYGLIPGVDGFFSDVENRIEKVIDGTPSATTPTLEVGNSQLDIRSVVNLDVSVSASDIYFKYLTSNWYWSDQDSFDRKIKAPENKLPSALVVAFDSTPYRSLISDLEDKSEIEGYMIVFEFGSTGATGIENKNKILEVAKTFIGKDTIRQYDWSNKVYSDNVCATFVSNVLDEAGVGVTKSCSLEKKDAVIELNNLFSESSDFKEVYSIEEFNGKLITTPVTKVCAEGFKSNNDNTCCPATFEDYSTETQKCITGPVAATVIKDDLEKEEYAKQNIRSTYNSEYSAFCPQGTQFYPIFNLKGEYSCWKETNPTEPTRTSNYVPLLPGDIVIMGCSGTDWCREEFQHVVIFKDNAGDSGIEVIHDGGAGSLISEKVYNVFTDQDNPNWYITHAYRFVGEFTPSGSKCNEDFSNSELSLDFSNCISANEIDIILEKAKSPAAGMGQAFYNEGSKSGIDPIFALAFFRSESSFGTAGLATKTNSVGNVRYSGTCPGSELKTTDSGSYCKYDTWEQSIEDWYRLVSSKTYVAGGLDTVEKIIPKYAPSEDNNNEAQYIKNVRSFVEANN